MADNDLKRLRQQADDAAQAAGIDSNAVPPPTPPQQAQAALASASQSTAVYGTAVREWKPLAHEEFEKLREAHSSNPHKEKMVDTIVALIDAQLAGKSETSVFDRPDTCAQNTYYTKWKDDPAFAECRENVGKIARQWKDTRAARALAESAEALQLMSKAATARLAEFLREDRATEDRDLLRAIFGILDRAGVETATKQGAEWQAIVQKVMDGIDLKKLSDEQLQRVMAGENVLMVVLDDYLSD